MLRCECRLLLSSYVHLWCVLRSKQPPTPTPKKEAGISVIFSLPVVLILTCFAYYFAPLINVLQQSTAYVIVTLCILLFLYVIGGYDRFFTEYPEFCLKAKSLPSLISQSSIDSACSSCGTPHNDQVKCNATQKKC